jgi:AsmA protein
MELEQKAAEERARLEAEAKRKAEQEAKKKLRGLFGK